MRRTTGFPIRLFIAGALLAGAVACRGAATTPGPELQGPPVQSTSDEQALQDFQKRVDAYVALHRKIEATLPHLPKEATPKQIDTNERLFGKQLAETRAGAKQGDLFSPAVQQIVRTHLTRMFAGKDGANLKASVMDENPLVNVKIAVNERYPDEVPLSTMPPEVLGLLPKMPEELEYRFVGRHLVIMDPHAHMIADFIPNVVPE
jgi:hypothetical protein